MPRRNNRPESRQRPIVSVQDDGQAKSAALELEAMARSLVNRGLASTNILDRPYRHTTPASQREEIA